jgi:hypothetical protein
MPIVNPQRWVRMKRSTPIHQPQEPEYDLDTVQQALMATVAVGRYDIAQQIVEEAKADVCVKCANAIATETVLYDPPVEGQQALLQVCESCASEFRG